MKIAISLVYHNDKDYLAPCFDSLLKSDINTQNLKLFCYDNASIESAEKILSDFEIEKWFYRSNTNDGIVIPRVKIYEEIIKEDFDFLLELHSDMLFPKEWFNELIKILDDETIILQPHIFLPKKFINLEYFESVLESLKYDKIYEKCMQVHPWLINLKLVSDVGGYYDINFSPHECEDDDFVYRILLNDKKIKSTGKSWVVHYGGVTRHKVLPSCLSTNMKYFVNKHNINFNDFKNMFEYHPYKMED